MKSKIYIAATALMLATGVNAQIRTSAYTSLLNPFLSNASQVSFQDNIKVHLNAITNVQGMEGSARSYNFSAQMPLQKTSGLGLKVLTQTAGAFQTVNLEGAYGKKVMLNDNNTLGFGLSVGFNQTNLKTEMLSSLVDRSDAALNSKDLNKMQLAVGAGFTYRYAKKAELALSFPHWISGSNPMSNLMVANASWNFTGGSAKQWAVKPILNYYYQSNTPAMTDALVQVAWQNTLSLSGGYRTNGSAIAMAGLSFNGFAFHYAYLSHVSGIQELAPAKNEIALVLSFNKPKPADKQKNMVVSDEVIQDEIDKINERLNGLMTIEKTNPGLVNMKKELVKLNRDLDKVLGKYRITNPQQIDKIKSLRESIDAVIAKYND